MKGVASANTMTPNKRAAITPESIASFDRCFSRKRAPVKAINKIITNTELRVRARKSASGMVSMFFHLIFLLIN